MPQQGQIIPEWLHPHVKTVINDNTVFLDNAAGPDAGSRAIFVITSGKGRDGVVLPFNRAQDYIEEFGNPNYKLYGQPGYMPHAWLSTGSAKAWVMRVMPADAAYANLIIIAKVKVDATVPASKKLVVRFEAVSHNNVVSKKDFADLTELLVSTTPDVDGFSTYPLFLVSAKGRGVYGNNIRTRVITSGQADKDNAYKNYRVELYELESTLQAKEVPFVGTLRPDSISGSQSLYIEDIINDAESGSQKIDFQVIEGSLEAIFALYKGQVNPTTTLTVDTFDVLYGKTKDNVVIADITIDHGTGSVALDSVEGLPLTGGTDGAFAGVGASRDTAIDAAYVAAFAGTTDKAILSKRRTPSEFIFDAGYTDTVKRALITLITKRYDASGYIDAGILNTVTDALAWGETMKAFGDFVFSKEMQHFRVRDPFSGKNIPVTMTYFLASVLPLHVKNFGNHIPFTGENHAKLAGAIKNSIMPKVDADDEDVKEQLYVLRLNYFQTIGENNYVRGTQTTSQNKWSDLSEEHNVRVTLDLKRQIENLVAGLTYDFAEKADRLRFKADAERIIAPYVGIQLRTATVDFQANAWEEERSILHCYLAVVFRSINKRGIIEIDINKRV